MTIEGNDLDNFFKGVEQYFFSYKPFIVIKSSLLPIFFSTKNTKTKENVNIIGILQFNFMTNATKFFSNFPIR
jgi:hypothetical protein